MRGAGRRISITRRTTILSNVTEKELGGGVGKECVGKKKRVVRGRLGIRGSSGGGKRKRHRILTIRKPKNQLHHDSHGIRGGERKTRRESTKMGKPRNGRHHWGEYRPQRPTEKTNKKKGIIAKGGPSVKGMGKKGKGRREKSQRTKHATDQDVTKAN